MLILSRKANESIVITCPDGTKISLIIVEMKGDRVRIGIDAPREVEVHRREVYEAIKRKERRDGSEAV